MKPELYPDNLEWFLNRHGGNVHNFGKVVSRDAQKRYFNIITSMKIPQTGFTL